MRVPLIAAAFLAACSTPDGITIEVVPVDGVTSVELLVPQRCNGTCGGNVTPPGYPEMSAKLHEVPLAAPVWTAELSDGVAGFRLLNDTDDPAYLPLIVAIGYRGTEAIGVAMLENVEIKSNESGYWRLIMSDAATIDPQNRAPNDTYRVLTWETADPEMASCVVVEHGPDRFAISPEGDNDCDELPQTPAECAPWAYQVPITPGSIATANCAMDVPLDTGRGACIAMGPLCSETLPSIDPDCSRIDEDYCLTNVVCQCAYSGWNSTCVKANGTALGSYIECTVPVTDGYLPCQSDTKFDPLDVQSFVATSAAAIEDVKVNELAATIGPFDGRADLTPTVKLYVDGFSSPHVVFKWNGPTNTAMMASQVALASLELDNDKHIVVPVVVSYAPSCMRAASCALHDVPNDSAKACAEATTGPSPSCVPSGNCTNGGVYCNNECCEPGETCLATGCSCASSSAGRCPMGYACTNAQMNLPIGGCGDACCLPGQPSSCLN